MAAATAELRKFVRDEIAASVKAIKAAGIKAQWRGQSFARRRDV